MWMAVLLYTLLWCAAGPLLFACSGRFRQGWRERLGLHLPTDCDIWIQGASAGECQLTAMLAPHLAEWSILATTCTQQGRDVLAQIPGTAIQARMLPLDLPPLLWLVLRRVRPKVLVLLETELWPGLLLACWACRIPVLILNARMSSRSLPGYLLLAPLLRACPPAIVGAIAGADARRYDLIFGPGTAMTTGNIKFDRALEELQRQTTTGVINPLAQLLPDRHRFIVLGSIREEEELQVLDLIHLLRSRCPDCIIGLCPRHMHRVPAWQHHLHGQTWTLRSGLTGPVEPGTVIVWDVFGELLRAYELADAAFVGGSLARLGGQNYLEPLACGIPVCVGPWTRNFDWVGKEIFDKLVFQSAYTSGLADILLSPAQDRETIRTAARAYIQARSGATTASLQLLHTHLPRSPHV